MLFVTPVDSNGDRLWVLFELGMFSTPIRIVTDTEIVSLIKQVGKVDVELLKVAQQDHGSGTGDDRRRRK